MTIRHDVAFRGDDGLTLRGWLFLPAGRSAKLPAITMAHGYAGIRQHGLERFARRFADAGFVVLLHDHRNFGASDAPEAGDIDPWRQIADWRHAISFLASREEVDPGRIGLWGTSYAGGHALILGATDRRLRAVVAQVPTTSGYQQSLRRVAPDGIAAMEQAFAHDDAVRAAGEPGVTISVVSSDAGTAAAYHSPEAVAFYKQPLGDGVWDNKVTLRSGRAARMYEPGIWAPRVSPTPLLFVVAASDTITPADLALDAFERALQPKGILLIPGGHFDAYLAQFDAASGAAVDWFQNHLG